MLVVRSWSVVGVRIGVLVGSGDVVGLMTGVTSALLAPGRLAGAALSTPRRLLDAVDRNKVAGRRASLRGNRAMIEVHGVGRADAAAFGERLAAALAEVTGVEWARLNAPLGRVVVALSDQNPPELAELVAVVDWVQRCYEADTGRVADRDRGDSLPVDHTATDRALWMLAASGAGAILSGVSGAMRRVVLPSELAALVTVVDSQPRLRRLLETTVGRSATDIVLAVASSLGQGLAGGRLGLGVDVAHRFSLFGEARSAHRAWCAKEPQLLAGPAEAAANPVAAQRPCPLPSGPVETYADRAALLGMGVFGLALPTTGNPRQAVNLLLAATPKAARVGRDGFAAGLGRLLAGRGAVVMDSTALRRLDRVDTVVLDADVLVTGHEVLGDVVMVSPADPARVAGYLHGLFSVVTPAAVRWQDGWVLGPVDHLRLRGNVGTRERRRLVARGAVHVLGLAEGDRLMAVASVVTEQSDSVEALAAACHRGGHRLVVAGQPCPAWTSLADSVLPGGRRLLGTVRKLQGDGAVVLLVSRHRAALGNADVGIGVSDTDGVPAWGAHVLVGHDVETAALLIDSCAVAARASRRGVALSQAGSVLGGVGVLTGRRWGGWSRPGQAATLGVNGAAALAWIHGTLAARDVGRLPMAPPVSRVPWHAVPVDAVLERLATTVDGLRGTEAARRRRQSRQPQPEQPSLARAVAEELDNPLTPILAGGAALSAAVGSVVDAGLVAGVSALSALAGGVQRRRTDQAVAQLLAESAVTARVWRDGAEVTRSAEQLVAGDVIDVRSGDVVPADCRVMVASGLLVDESALTGEAFPVSKQPDPVIATAVADRTCMLYEGTTVAAGRGRAVVVATGESTEAGRSMAATRGAAPPTGVEARLAAITSTTLPIALGSAVGVIAAGLLRGRPLQDTLSAGVSLAVASVPEGLPFLVGAAQLASARRLSESGVLVRNPRTIEALGRVDTLCFDKTGTLTQGRIGLAAVADASRTVALDQLCDAHRETLVAALRATPARRGGRPLAHLTDRAVTTGAEAAGLTREHGLPGWRRIAALPFEPSRGFHATVGGAGDRALLSVKGAPETVLPRCTRLRDGDREVSLDGRRRARLNRRVERLTSDGYRVLAVAQRRDRPRRHLADADVDELTMLGFLALSDPIRPTAAASIAALRAAGVQIVMITGDHPGTARTIADQLDVLNGSRVITGAELDALDDTQLDHVLPEIGVVARGTPAHKVRVVQAFQRLHRTVAMTGDGANDAPAIRLADVGIALGRRAAPAARAAADLVVTDDRLETIIAALTEGRGMWASVRQALGILVGGNLGEIGFTVLGAAVTGSSPLSARQLLLVNLLTDLAPAMTIALRKPDADATTLLAEGPEASLGAALTRDITQRAITTAAAATTAWTAARLTGRARRARTVALAALVGTQLGQTVATGRSSPAVVGTSLGSAALLGAVIQTPGVSQFFGCTPLGPLGWTIAGTAATVATVAPPLVPHIGSALTAAWTAINKIPMVPPSFRETPPTTPKPNPRTDP